MPAASYATMVQEWRQSVRACLPRLIAVTALLTSVACGARSIVSWDHAVSPGTPIDDGTLFVMTPQWTVGANTGNVGRDVGSITSDVGDRILGVARQRMARAELVPANVRVAVPLPTGYESALHDPVTSDERRAASWTVEHGVPYLLVPTIVEWKEMRTDDPIGALILPHDSVAITVRLMRVEPPAIVGQATFRNRARLTLNQRAEHLLDQRFQKMVLDLLSGTGSSRHP
jgi:hypothetical protein